MAAIPPPVDPTSTAGTVTTTPPTPTPPTSTLVPSPPSTISTEPSTPTSTTSTSTEPTQTTGKPKPSGGGGSGGRNPNTGGTNPTTNGPSQPTPPPDGDSNTGESQGGSKSVAGPVVGAIAGVLVLAFLIGVFVMRYKKKSKARKRRLDFLNEGTANTGGGGGGGALGVTAGTGASTPRVSGAGGGRPGTPSGGRPIEMSGIAGGAPSRLQHENYDYQQGYQQAPYGGGPQDQYDPYYAQQQQAQGYYPDQQQQQGYYPDQQQQGYYPDQQQGYYPEEQYQHQFMPPAPLGAHNNNVAYSQGTGSPSMTHVTASPKSYPQPPLSTTSGAHSNLGTPLQSVEVSGPAPGAYDKYSKVENEYAGTQSHARNPQLVPENEERIKVPL